jgi:AraC family transcriptional regulator
MTGTGAGVEKTVDVRVHTGIGEVSIVRERFSAPFNGAGQTKPSHHLQLSLLPMPQASTACFEDVWAPHRFEPMGQLFLFPAQSPLRIRSACRTQHSLVCDLPPAAIRAWFDTDFDWTDQHLTGSLDIASRDVRRLMNAMIAELNAPGFAQEAMVELLTGQICVTLARHFRDIDCAPPAGGLAPWRMRLIDEYLEADPGGATIAGLARHCGLSPRHLSRAFRASAGRSLGEHMAQRRIAVACRMLGAGASIKQTAFATGFSAPTNFATAFRRATGCSPRGYRDGLARERSFQ